MKGQDKFLTEFIDGARNRFIIPVYQRNYDWKKKIVFNYLMIWSKLFRTINRVIFFGSIVYSPANNGQRNDYLIIDGQQRITTVSLILAAMVNLMKEGTLVSEKPSLCKYIEETF